MDEAERMPETATADVESRARRALAASPIYALRQLHVEHTSDGQLVVSGRVDTFYHKQLAQELLRGVAKGRPLINVVDVE